MSSSAEGACGLRPQAVADPSALRAGPEPGEGVAGVAWSLRSLAGRVVEVSDSGAAPALTAAAALVLEVQEGRELAAWIGLGDSVFFPPDLAGWGIDLEALPVVRVPDLPAACSAAERLLRCGAFGLVVLDLKTQAGMRLAVQSRLAALARRHRTTLLCLTRKKEGAPSLGPLVSIRGEGRISRTAFGRFDWEIRITKDRQGAPGWSHMETCRGTDGLC